VDFTLTTDEQQLVSIAKLLADREIRPNAQKAWDEGRCPTEVLRAMGGAGLLGLLVPEEWGGSGVSTVGFVAAMDEIGQADQSIASAWQAHSTIGTIPLLNFGTDEQRERWLRPLAEGRALGAFGLTEPDAGSDARAISTRATKVDGGWLINGTKSFISNAGTDMSWGVVVLARTGDRGNGEPGFGNFIVERETEGYTTGPKLQGIGWRGLDTRQLFFSDVFVPDDHVLGGVGNGLGQFLSTLEVGRIAIAALSNSLTAAVLRMATDYANQRSQFGAPIASYQAIQFKLADIATELEASRWLTYRAAQLRDSSAPFKKEAAMAKLKASRLAMSAASEAVQVFGGLGYMQETPVARFFCDAKVLEIGEGTNEIQHLVIAREIGCLAP
jgi:alkylation response protein AidB-like acyl-CoA dehydrogenase